MMDESTASSRDDFQDAAVLVPIYEASDGELTLIIVRRSDEGLHGGELAFPGGKRISDNSTLRDTALREAKEEIGITLDRVEILERLPSVETQTTRFRIIPFLARIVPPLEWRLEEREITELLEVRIGDLASPDAHGEEYRLLPSTSKPMRISFYRIGQYKLWGATYRILKPLIPRLLAGEWLRNH